MERLDFVETAPLIRRVWQLLEPELLELGYELVEVEYGRQGGASLLRVFIDNSAGGVTLDDCTRVAQVVSPLLDEADFISEHYMMEVSSPGVNRPVRKADHFRRYVGEAFRIATHAPIEGRTRFKGVLKEMETDLLYLETPEQTFVLHLDNIKKARLDR